MSEEEFESPYCEELKTILDKLEIVARKHTIEVCEDGSKIETMPASIVDELRLNNYSAKLLLNYIQQKENIIKKVREYIIQYGNLYCLKHKQFKDYHQYKVILEILDKGDGSNDK